MIMRGKGIVLTTAILNVIGCAFLGSFLFLYRVPSVGIITKLYLIVLIVFNVVSLVYAILNSRIYVGPMVSIVAILVFLFLENTESFATHLSIVISSTVLLIVGVVFVFLTNKIMSK